MLKHVYKSPIVNRQTYRARVIISSLYSALKEDKKFLPISVQRRIEKGANENIELVLLLALQTEALLTYTPNYLNRTKGQWVTLLNEKVLLKL